MKKRVSRLSSKKRYLQIALNGTKEDAREIVFSLPINDRIIIEAGTPLIKRYGVEIIKDIKNWYLEKQVLNVFKTSSNNFNAFSFGKLAQSSSQGVMDPYIVADLKTMDRGKTEVDMVADIGASAVIALGVAPIETLNSFIEACKERDTDSMIDMMNVPFPLNVLRALKKPPDVVILHRGVDEEDFNKEKMIPLHEIRRVKGFYNMLISVAGGDTQKDVQRAVFNDSDIVVLWRSVFSKNEETLSLVEGFLKDIK